MRAPFRLPISAERNREYSKDTGLAQGGEKKLAALVFKVGKNLILRRAALGFGFEPSKQLKFVLVDDPAVGTLPVPSARQSKHT
jgi:hypothetical protein